MNTEIIAGGASLAPSLWSLLAEAIDALNKSAWSCTALIVFIDEESQKLQIAFELSLRFMGWAD
ncbi:MAG: hypothetical protein U0T36_07095 [Saprospiraceae bacterium]